MSAEATPLVRTPQDLTAQGRPRIYSEEDAQAVLDSVMETGSLLKACESVGVAIRTVRKWASLDPSFSAALSRAREHSAPLLAEQVMLIADDPATGACHEAVGHAKLRMEARKWLASKYAPGLYGDKLELSGDVNISVSIKRFAPDAIDVTPTVDGSVDKP